MSRQEDGVPLGLQVAHEHLVAALEVPDPGRVASVGLFRKTCLQDINPKMVSVRHKLEHITVDTLVVVEPGVWVIVVQRRKGFPSAITSKAFTSCSSR